MSDVTETSLKEQARLLEQNTPLDDWLQPNTRTVQARVYTAVFEAQGTLHVRSQEQGNRALTAYLQQQPEYLILTDVQVTQLANQAVHACPVLHVRCANIIGIELL